MTDQKTITTIIWIVFAGICFGAFYAFYHRRLVGDIVRDIIKKEAVDENSAVTLEQLGYKNGIKNAFARFAFKKGSAARKYIYTVYEESAPVKKNEDELFVRAEKPLNEQKYYIPEEKRTTAEVKYDGKGTSITTVLITIAVFFAVALIAVSILPWILTNAGRLFGGSPDTNDNITSGDTVMDVQQVQDADANSSVDESPQNNGISVNTDEKTGVSSIDPNELSEERTDAVTE